MHRTQTVSHKPRALLLQGPVGPFFNCLAQDLSRAGWLVRKVNFNGGDEFFFSGQDAYRYQGTLSEWPDACERLIRSFQPERIYLFGDCRPVHRPAIEIARRLGVRVFVFEEGYVRPDYITLEENGVNSYSDIPRDPRFYHQLPEESTKATPSPPSVGKRFFWAAWYATLYCATMALARQHFPHYQHHRPLEPLVEGVSWLRAGLRKLLAPLRDQAVLRRAKGELSKRYFLVPLQVHNDSQIQFHSPFGGLESFIRRVVVSFAEHADADAHLIFKHHPMDRAYRNYRSMIRAFAADFGISDRVHCTDDAHLPTLIHHARGVVVINSTTALSALHHAKPVIALGEACYNIPGLCHQGSLESFWHKPQPVVNYKLYLRFRYWLIRTTQLPGSFYKPAFFPQGKAVLGHAGAAIKSNVSRRRGNPKQEELADPLQLKTPSTPHTVAKRYVT